MMRQSSLCRARFDLAADSSAFWATRSRRSASCTRMISHRGSDIERGTSRAWKLFRAPTALPASPVGLSALAAKMLGISRASSSVAKHPRLYFIPLCDMVARYRICVSPSPAYFTLTPLYRHLTSGLGGTLRAGGADTVLRRRT